MWLDGNIPFLPRGASVLKWQINNNSTNIHQLQRFFQFVAFLFYITVIGKVIKCNWLVDQKEPTGNYFDQLFVKDKYLLVPALWMLFVLCDSTLAHA